MEFVTAVDSRGRISIPRQAREAMGLKSGDLVLIKIRGDGVAELIPLHRAFEDVFRAFNEKLRDWREEDHEASRVLE